MRVGGLSIWAGFIPVALLAPPVAGVSAWVALGAWLAVAVVSLLDDWRGVHPVPRLAVHGIAALLVAIALWGPLPATGIAAWALAVALTLLAIAWSANLFNFMDGNDGLAAMMALGGFAAYAVAAAMAGAPAALYAALAAATVPFLAVNLPPARAFMGDVGAVPLGFLAAAFGIAGWRTGVWPGWFPVLVFLPFVADATATLLRRAARGERVWEAHRTHYYQRYHQMGAGHGGTLAALRRSHAGRRRDRARGAGTRPWRRLGGGGRPGPRSRRRCSRALIIIGVKSEEHRDARRPETGALAFAFVHDVCAAALAWAAIYWLRFNLDFSNPYYPDMSWTLAWILPLQAAIFLAFGLYRGLWRFASMLDLQRIVLAAGLGALLIPLVLVMLQLHAIVPRSVLDPLSDRAHLPDGRRAASPTAIWKEHRLYSPLAALGEPVLIVGAGEAGARLTQGARAQPAMARRRAARRRPGQAGTAAAQRQRAGSDRRAAACGRRSYGVRKVIIALPSAASRRAPPRRRALRRSRRRGADRAVVRGPDQRPLALTTIRNVELDDLLGRDPVVLDSAGLAEWLGDRVVHGHRRRRLDRRRAVPPDRALPAGAARAVRPFRSRALRDPDGAGGRVPAAAARGGRRRRQARGAGRGGARARAARASSSMPARTSTCR